MRLMAAAEVSALSGVKERDSVYALTAAGTFAGTRKKRGPLVHSPGPRQPRVLSMNPGYLRKKLSHIFSSFLKILVDKSVGICYYN